MVLSDLGWNDFFANALPSGSGENSTVARVAAEHRGGYDVWSEIGEGPAEVSGKLRHLNAHTGKRPVVGDWVVLKKSPEDQVGLINQILPRRTCISRTAAGRTTDEQVIAANVDHVFIVASLSDALNLRRIERYLLLACQSGAVPSLLLTKRDLCPDVHAAVKEVLPAAAGVDVHVVCGLTGEGINQLDKILLPGQTAVLLGPSGVGKSTLINCWANEDWMHVQPVRESDQKGRHTTTHRQMIKVPSGGLIIDTPGMRELQLWGESDEGLRESFGDVENLATECRFTNCRHEQEPGCAVQAAIKAGDLDENRLKNHRKMQEEIRHFEEKHDKRAQAKTRRKIKAITKKFNDRNRDPDQDQE